MTSRYLNACVYVFLLVYYFLFFYLHGAMVFLHFVSYIFRVHATVSFVNRQNIRWFPVHTLPIVCLFRPFCFHVSSENTRTHFVSPGRFLLLYTWLTLKCHEHEYVVRVRRSLPPPRPKGIVFGTRLRLLRRSIAFRTPPSKTSEYRIHTICMSDSHNAICLTDLHK